MGHVKSKKYLSPPPYSAKSHVCVSAVRGQPKFIVEPSRAHAAVRSNAPKLVLNGSVAAKINVNEPTRPVAGSSLGQFLFANSTMVIFERSSISSPELD